MGSAHAAAAAAPAATRDRWLHPAAVAWYVGLALLPLLPLLRPGYALSYDMVFVPDQTLLPSSLGLAGGLPRAVPQDAVVALVDTVAPGWVWQRVALVGALLGAGLGVARLLRHRPWWVGSVGATLYVWSAYLAERLVQGHWGLLIAYATLPWLLAAAIGVRRGVARAGLRLLLLAALTALTPTGGLLAAVIALPPAIGPRSRANPVARVLLAAGVVAVNLPWLLPSVLHPAAGQVDPAGVEVFALRAEGPWGAAITALGTGGIWNGSVVLPSRSWWTSPLLALAVAGLALLGARALVRLLGRATAGWLALVAASGWLLAVGSAVLPDAYTWLVSSLPGGGLLRDAQKLLAPLALLLALTAPLGLVRVIGRVADAGGRGALVALALVVLLAALPDLAGGAGGRLAAVDYPPEWAAVADAVATSPRDGDVLVLPWSAFRAYPWNGDRTVLDPLPRWLPRSSVTDDTLRVRRPDGSIATVAGEDPRAAAVTSALDEGTPLATVLPGLGIGLVVLATDQRPAPPATALAGLDPVRHEGPLVVYAVPGDVAVAPTLAHAGLVAVVDGLVVALVAGVGIVLLAGALRDRRGTRRAAPTRTGGNHAAPRIG